MKTEPKIYEHVFDVCFSCNSSSPDPESVTSEERIRGLEIALDAAKKERGSERIQYCETYE
jgi:hypothetical protein